MHLCDFKPCFVAIVRPFLLSTQCLLSFLQFAAFCVKAFGIGNLFTVTQSNQTCDTQINPNLIGAWRQWFNLNIHQQGNCPSSSSRELHRDSCWCCAFGQLSTPTNRQRQGTLGKEHLPVSELEGRLGKLCTPTVSFLLEGWIFRPSLKEIR